MTRLRVWKIHLDRPSGPGWWRSLSDTERERARRLGSVRERHRFTVAHAALRAILGEVCGVRAARLAFGAEDGGRPYLALPQGRAAPDFNLSHSEEWALVAVAPPGSRVGVDVERIREDLDCLAMAGSMYQPEEVDRLRAADPAGCRTGYFRLWTAKEAYVKTVGVGLAGLRNVLVHEESTAHGTVLSSSSPPGAALPVRWLDVAPGYAAAVVTAAGAS
ncbi:4'-phosphopantetheinyl transferase superfamily protein [Nonomuraea sp. NPDC026600]|uniref:4'-phosphopantetheinyl transferase family protein n=1 Tax=Nonomuraea sp. NPDC026600 TaxID=3155363 RepID=UPI0033EF03F2